MIPCQLTRRGEPDCSEPATWIDELDVLWCEADALEVRRASPGKVRLRRIATDGAWWPPVAVGAAALLAFTASIWVVG